MLRAAARLIRADLATRPAQAALTGLVIAIAAGTLLATAHLRAVLAEPYDELMRATRGAHVAVTGSPEQVERAVAAAGEGVVAGEPRREIAIAGPDHLAVTVLPAGAEIDRPLVSAGRLPDAPGEVLLDAGLARERGVVVGGELAGLEVVGTGVLPRRATAGWVATAAGFARERGRGPVVTVPLRLRDPQASGAVAARLAAAGALTVGDWQRSRAEYTEESRRTLAILSLATVLALLAAGFTLATAIGGRVLAERRRIGLLRAVGMTPGGVTAALVAHYLAVAAVAAPLGLVAGRLLAPALSNDTAALLEAPPPGPPGAGLAALVLAAVLAAVALACAVPAWRAGRLAPVAALEPARAAGSRRASRAAALARTLRLPVTTALGAKDVFVQRVRAGLTMASVALAAVIVLCALAFESTMDRISADPALRAQPWDLSVDPTAATPAAAERMLTAAPGVTAVGRRYELPASAGRVRLGVRAVEGPPDAFAFAVPDGRPVRAAGEVTLGRGALEQLGVGIGGTVDLRVRDREIALRVVGRHIETRPDALGAVVTADSVPEAALGKPTLIARVADRDAAPDIAADLQRRAGDALIVIAQGQALRREIDELRPIVYGVTALLLAIAAVNLLTTLVLGVRERRRDVAIFGALGASRRQLTATVVSGGVLLALPAALLGFPLGAWLFTTLIGMTDPADGPDVATLPALWAVVAALAVGMVGVAAVSAVAARETARVALAAALRAE